MCKESEEFAPNLENNIESQLTPEIIAKKKKEYTEMIKRADTEVLASEVPNPWKVPKKRSRDIANAVGMFQTGFGLYAAIPMLCKGEDCVYAQLFPELHDGAVENGERCPVEVSFIMAKYQQYLKELDIHEDDAVDMSLLRDLIDYDIQILRADTRIAIEGGFTEDQVVAISEKTGEPIYKEAITATAEYKDKIQNKRNRTLELLNSTRKDKEGMKVTHNIDPSSYATKLLKKFHDNQYIDISGEFEEIEVIDDVPYMKELKKENARREEASQEEVPQLTFEELYEDDK